MRDYGTVAPTFWTRGTGKALRGNADAQLMALYLCTCPNATVTGLFYLPLVTIMHETGLTEAVIRTTLSRYRGERFEKIATGDWKGIVGGA